MDELWQSVNLPGVHFAGTLTQVRDYRRSSSAFIHGFRYNARVLVRMLEQRDHGVPWPSRVLPRSPEAMTEAALDRVNNSSALWQQFGYLCDAIGLGPDGSCRYFEEVPLDYLVSLDPFGMGEYFTVTLEYGTHKRVDPFNQSGRIERTDAAGAQDSAFLHPVMRHYRDGQLQAVHHVIEDLAAEWRESEHVEPLRAFVAEHLSMEVSVPLVSDIRELGSRGAVQKRASSL